MDMSQCHIIQCVLWLRDHSVIAMLAVFSLLALSLYGPGTRGKVEQDALIPFRDET